VGVIIYLVFIIIKVVLQETHVKIYIYAVMMNYRENYILKETSKMCSVKPS